MLEDVPTAFRRAGCFGAAMHPEARLLAIAAAAQGVPLRVLAPQRRLARIASVSMYVCLQCAGGHQPVIRICQGRIWRIGAQQFLFGQPGQKLMNDLLAE